MTANQNHALAREIELATFGEAGAIERIGINEGVAIKLVQGAGGRPELEVRIAPLAAHGNHWPTVVLGPGFWPAPHDFSGYSLLATSIRKISAGVNKVNVQWSTRENDGGRNLEGELITIPSGMTVTASMDTASFDMNDPSAINYLYLVFMPTVTEEVFRIESVKAIYDPGTGSPAETLNRDITTLSTRFETARAKIDWQAMPAATRTEWREKLAAMEKNIAQAEADNSAAKAAGLSGRYRPLQAQASKLTRDFGALVMAGRKGFYAWEIDPYLNVLRDELPSPQNKPLASLTTQMALNEFRDALFMVSATGPDLRLSVQVQPGPGLPRKALLLQETLYLKNNRNQETGDGLVPLQGPLLVPRGESRQLRLRFDARFSGLKPGNYTYTVTLRDEDSGRQQVIPGRLQVWNFSLPSYDILTNNAYAEFDSSEFRDGVLLRKAIEHMKPYGLNLVSVHPSEMPRVIEMDEAGNITKFERTRFENRIRPTLAAWKASPGSEKLKFMFSFSALWTPEWNQGLIRPGVTYFSEPWKRGFTQWFNYLTATIRELGIADGDWILNLGDEASVDQLTRYEIPLGELIKSINPNIILINNTSTILSDPATSERFFKVFDIFQPDNTYGVKANPYLLKWIMPNAKAQNKPVWTYQCLGDMGARSRNTYEYYRVYGWELVQNGFTGTGLWTYGAQNRSPYEVPSNGFCLVFKQRDKDEIAHYRRYELYREGVDDYRYVWAYREAARRRGPAAEKQAEQLVSEALRDITANTRDTARCEKWRVRLAGEILKLKS